MFRHLAADHAQVLLFDDAHWADASSLLLLDHVAGSMAGGTRLLLVVTHWDTEPLHEDLTTELRRQRATTELVLGGLSVSTLGASWPSSSDAARPASEVERVHARTGGNPFFVGEVGRVLSDGRAEASAPPVTVSVREAIRARLNQLPQAAARTLQAASIIGCEFSVAMVAAMVESPAVICLAALDSAAACVHSRDVPLRA